MTNNLTAQDLRPDRDFLAEATLTALKGRVEEGEVRRFLKEASSKAAPDPIGANASLNIAVWGKATCDPDGQPWKFDHTVWGGPAFFAEAVGFMYTAYNSWDAFFRNVTSIHAQGIASDGGVLQFTWFIKSGLPVGQFTGLAGGIGLIQAGGPGEWQRK